jgi:hypothetical protein
MVLGLAVGEVLERPWLPCVQVDRSNNLWKRNFAKFQIFIVCLKIAGGRLGLKFYILENKRDLSCKRGVNAHEVHAKTAT